ncbi:hypothetical protein CVT24_012538 [Panaeolus cyanescens]|uniref:Homeobox domain-containing protein n=1 Tax=Panaeolus cyanescens TaxID=181874 RepID=A0A409W646_9AGAR|nr:hypothetical protein CVT24_012538 [Panaeolus cyanescens]
MPSIVTPSLNGVHSALTSPASAVGPSDKFEDEDNDDNQRSSVGPQRNSSLSGSSTGKDKEKRKRSRVTPEQLEELERYFAVNRSPNSAQRRELSERLGMYDRQTQIWFQNRRAKAKLLDGKPTECAEKTEPVDNRTTNVVVDKSPEPWTDAETVQHLVHEEAPILVIPSPEIKIGAWKRQACQSGKLDLIWLDFKMEVPFSIICRTQLLHKPDRPKHRNATAVLSLVQPPIFMIQDTSVGLGGEYRWQRCGDWTEGKQASQILQHELTGNVKHINHILGMVARRVQTEQTQVSLVPSYPHHSTIPAASLKIPQALPISAPAILPVSAPVGHISPKLPQVQAQASYGTQHRHYSNSPSAVIQQQQFRSDSNHGAYMHNSFQHTTPTTASPQPYSDYSQPPNSAPAPHYSSSLPFDTTPRATCQTTHTEFYNNAPLQVNTSYFTNDAQPQQTHYGHQFNGMTSPVFDNQGYYYGQGMSA